MCIRPLSGAVLAALASLLLSSCGIGATAIRVNRFDYNSAVQSTAKQQLLANIVRMRAYDVPLFLDVTSITVTNQVEGGIAGKGTFPGGEFGGNLSYNEQPIVAYAPVQGDALVKQFMLPIDPAVIVNLYHSGWRLDWLLFLILDRLTPRREDFFEATRVLQDLDDIKALDLGTTQDQSQGGKEKAKADKDDDKEKTPPNRTILFGVDPRNATWPRGELATPASECPNDPAHTTPDALARCLLKKLETLLQVDRSAKSTPRVLAGADLRAFSATSLVAIEVSKGDTAARKDTILAVDNARVRSPLGALKHTADTVTIVSDEATPCDSNTVKSSDAGNENLTLVMSAKEPSRAYAKVKYDGCWYFIRSDDGNARFVFSLLAQLLAMQSSSQTGPQLTIPVGR